MNVDRYQELVGQLFEGELTEEAATELAREYLRHGESREDLRVQLHLWEIWSQAADPARSAAAFVAGWKTRVSAEADGGAFAAAVRQRLVGERRAGAWFARLIPGWRAWPRPLGPAFAAVAGVVVALLCWVAVPRSPAASTTLRGEAVCPACVLHVGHEHLPAVRVTRDGVSRTYYLEPSAELAGLQSRFCGGPTPVVVRGTITAPDRIDAATIVLPRPKPKPADDQRVLFPL